ncbi:MAG: redoxin domain-containing protein [Bacteroidales bacterium]
MLKRIVWFFLLLIPLTFCVQKKDDGVAVIKGQFTEYPEQLIYFQELEVKKTIPLDSVRTDDQGKFVFNLHLDDVGFYLLKTGPTNHLILLIEKNENMEVFSSNIDFFSGYEVSGSPGSELLAAYNDFMFKQKSRIDSIGKVYNESKGSKDFLSIKNKLDSVYLSIVDDQKKYIQHFINKNPGSLASLIVLNRKLGMAEVVDEVADFRWLFITDSLLSQKYPGNKHVLDHHQRVKEIQTRIFDNYLLEQKLKPGQKAPDIVLPDTSGNPVSLKSFTGKPMIVYFWAGWNAVSRQDNRKLVALYPELTAKGFDILGVSLDENNIVWKGAIKLDKLPWKQVSDLQGLNSTIKQDFHVPDDLPYYYLLNEELKIVSKNNQLDSILIKLDEVSLSN